MTTDQAEKVCPFCAETIKAAAKVCKHCGRDLPAPPVRRIFDDAPPVAQQRASRTTGTQTMMRLLVVLIIAPATAFFISLGGQTLAGLAVAILLVTAVSAYFLPSYEAWLREHQSLTGVVLLNVFLGWTLVGWVAALVWGVSGGRRP